MGGQAKSLTFLCLWGPIFVMPLLPLCLSLRAPHLSLPPDSSLQRGSTYLFGASLLPLLSPCTGTRLQQEGGKLDRKEP